jgi:hypothetical protein
MNNNSMLCVIVLSIIIEADVVAIHIDEIVADHVIIH